VSEAKAKLLVTIGTLARMGGAERQALYLVEHLKALAWSDVEVLTFNDGPMLHEPLAAMGVKVHAVSYEEQWPRAKRARALAKLAVMLRWKIKPTALLPFGAPSSKVMGLVWPASGARFCWWNQQDEGRGLNGTSVERKLLHRVRTLNSNSTAGRDFLANTYGLPESEIAVYNNGTPLPDLSSSPADWRSRLGLGDRKIVTMVANLTRFKDHATLLEAWANVRAYFGPTAAPALLLAGYLTESETVTKLKLQAFDLGLSNSDVYFLGAVEDIGKLFASTDLVVHSSVAEGCPNAVCEAMAAGNAVVATDIPGCRQALGNDQDRWLVKPRDSGALARRIIELLESDEQRALLGNANRERIRTDFSVDGMNRFFQTQIELGLGRTLSYDGANAG
jgi:glycosyltransferase involved in cell wall biosynthesis